MHPKAHVQGVVQSGFQLNFKFNLMKFTIEKMIFTCAVLFTMTACGTNKTKQDQSGPEYTSAYVCPMHCKGSGSDESGNCPVCGMEYIKNNKEE